MLRSGPRNLITDIAGLSVGNAHDNSVKTGATVLTADSPFTASVHIMGGAPGTRETDLLAPDKTVAEVDALVLSGGSAFGLDAASGVMDGLRSAGRGFQVGTHLVPIVPGAIIFDLANGGDKNWPQNPYRALGEEAYRSASTRFEIGTAGAGFGATTAALKAGLGSASVIVPSGHIVGALVVANPVGCVTMGDSPHFWAHSQEMNAEYGSAGPNPQFNPCDIPRTKLDARSATTIAIVATDAVLDKAGCARLATAAHDGIARATWPAHTPHDGDLIFAAATGEKTLTDTNVDTMLLGHAAAICIARAIARAVYEATPSPGDIKPTYREKYLQEILTPRPV
ncbi:MAG: P1 family peptidase [Litoreibacter sp.]